MRVINSSYADKLTRDDLLFRYSRTAQAVNADGPKQFDAVLSEASSRQQINSGRDALLADIADVYSCQNDALGRDSLLADAADMFARAKYSSGRYDPVLAVSARNGEASCV